MTLTMSSIAALMRLTFSDPKAGAQAVLDAGVPATAYWLIAGLVVVLSALFVGLNQLLLPVELPEGSTQLPPSMSALFIGGNLLVLIFAIHWVGRAFGGTGTLGDSILLMSWLQAVLLVLQIVVGVLTAAAPFLGGLAFVAVAAYTLWLLVNFIDVIHGFGSLGKSAMMLLLAIVGMALGFGMLLSIMGVGVPGGSASV